MLTPLGPAQSHAPAADWLTRASISPVEAGSGASSPKSLAIESHMPAMSISRDVKPPGLCVVHRMKVVLNIYDSTSVTG